MATKHTPLTRSELALWQRAFLAAELSVLMKSSANLSPAGAAHIAAEYASAAVVEYRNAKQGASR